MLTHLVFTLLALLSPSDADGLRKSAPAYLTIETAAAHAFTARWAALAYDVDPDVLLAIAYRESRYTVAEVTPEVGGRWSCGVMTPTPLTSKAHCEAATGSMLAGYLAGAKHLRVWLDACRGNERCAHLGYAGGYRLIETCKTKAIRPCSSPEVVRFWARKIQRLRASGFAS